MCSSGRRPDPGSFAAAGPSEQRAAKRSARRRREAPKQQNKNKNKKAPAVQETTGAFPIGEGASLPLPNRQLYWQKCCGHTWPHKIGGASKSGLYRQHSNKF